MTLREREPRFVFVDRRGHRTVRDLLRNRDVGTGLGLLKGFYLPQSDRQQLRETRAREYKP